MAKIYTASEAYKIIRQGINKTAMQEIAEQAPVFAMYAAKGADEIISALPDFITVQKIEKAIKGENIPEPVKVSEPALVPTVETVAEEPEQEKEQPVAKEKGKRGRPAKAKEEKPDTEEQPKKKRGRPAKVKEPALEPVEEEQDEDEQEEETEPEQEIEPDEPETEEPADDDDDWEI